MKMIDNVRIFRLAGGGIARKGGLNWIRICIGASKNNMSYTKLEVGVCSRRPGGVGCERNIELLLKNIVF
jgi:hypothetical protein